MGVAETSDAGETQSAETAADTTADEGIDAPAQEAASIETPDPIAAPPRPVAVSSLTRVRYVAPRYPRSAERRGISGWVDVVFTVSIDGTVTDVGVLNSEPGDVFVNAATKAVEKWEFEAVIENGRLVEKQAAVRMMFAL